MLFLLRNIRRKLLSDNRFTTYVLYAIGEIILVVVGILIAISIDNWNAHRKDAQNELKALIDLKAEFRDNYSKLLRDKQIKLKGIEYTKKRIRAYEEKNPLPILTIDTIFWHGAYTYNGSNAVLNSLLNSGEIVLISNDSLKYMLSAWPELVNDFYEDELIHVEFIVNDYTGYQREKLSIGVSPSVGDDPNQWFDEHPIVKQRYQDALNDPLLYNLLQNNLVLINIVLREYVLLEQTMIDIQQMIDREIQAKS